MTTGPLAQFFEHLRAGRFMIQRVRSDGRHVFYPRHVPGGEEWDWVEASGAGTVYSRTVIRQKPERGGDFCIALVDLAEGPRMLTRIVGLAPADVTIGMPVRAELGDAPWNTNVDHPVVLFRPVREPS